MSVLIFYGGISTVSAFLSVKSHHPFERDQVILGLRKAAVEQLDPVSGEVIQRFNSQTEASRQTGISRMTIRQAINGQRRHAGTYLWRRQGDQSTPELFEKPPTSVNVPVEQLDPVTGEIIQSFKSISEASRKTNISDGSIHSALRGRTRHAGSYLWRRKGDKAIPTLFEGAPNTFSTKQVPVEQLDPVTGEVIHTFESIAEASRQTGILKNSIIQTLGGKYRHAGKFLWRQKGDRSTVDLLQSPPSTKRDPIPIEQLDPVTGEVIQSFKSIAEAMRQTGILSGSISRALNGKQRHAGTYLWRRQGDQTIPDLFESPPMLETKKRVVPVEQLDPYSGNVIRSFKSVNEASRETGILQNSISQALNGIHLHAGTYVWRRKYEKTAPEVFEYPSTQEKGKVPVPVEQLDPYSGCVIQRYESIEEASQQSRIPSGDIDKVLSGKRRHAGLFLWKRQDDQSTPALFERITRPTKPYPVEQVDLVTGEVMQRFESIAEASRQTGIAAIGISQVVNGKQRHAGRYLWRRKGD